MRLNRYTRFDTHYTWSVLKNGKQGKRIISSCGPWYTPLNECDVCGYISTPKKVQHRNELWGWNLTDKKDYTTKSKEMLCMSCWNKIRPLVMLERESNEVRTLINKLKREFHGQTNQNHG